MGKIQNSCLCLTTWPTPDELPGLLAILAAICPIRPSLLVILSGLLSLLPAIFPIRAGLFSLLPAIFPCLPCLFSCLPCLLANCRPASCHPIQD